MSPHPTCDASRSDAPGRRCQGIVLLPVLLLCLNAIPGCGSDDAHTQSENYGNLLASPGGLVVFEEEHPTGWMRAECFACHVADNMHQVNRTGLADEEVDLPGIRAIIESGGESSCSMCHGTNGVEP